MPSFSSPWALIGLLISSARPSYSSVISISIPASNSSISSSPTADTATTNVPSTITSAPYYPTSTDNIAPNNCSYYNTQESRTLWNSPWCSVYAGTVELFYWPTNDNYSYPSTYYDSLFDYTYTSPSVYMAVSSLYGSNACGLLGPSTSRKIFEFDLTEVSTLVPYTDETATSRRSTRQLYLSDLGSHCTGSYDVSTLTTQRHPIKDDDTRCNPSIVMPYAVKKYGMPYWLHCGVHNFKFGLFDPPYAIPTADALIATTAAPASTKGDGDHTAASAASTQAMAASDLATTTAGGQAAASTDASEDSDSNSGNATINPDGDDESSRGSSSTQASSGNSNQSSDETEDSEVAKVSQASTAASVVSTISQQVVSLGTAGIEVINYDGTTSSAYTISVSNGPAASVTVYDGTTLSVGGSAMTVNKAIVTLSADANSGSTGPYAVDSSVTKQVVSLGTAGVEVVNYGSSTTSTYTVPGSSNSIPSVTVYHETTLTLGGSAITVNGADIAHSDVNDLGVVTSAAAASDGNAAGATKQVVSLGTAGLEVVEDRGSTTVTYTLSSLGSSTASVTVYDGITLTLGGSAKTVTNSSISSSSGTSTPKSGHSVASTKNGQESDAAAQTSVTSQVESSPATKMASRLLSLAIGVLMPAWFLC